jgi:hypothetical protein
VEEAAELWSAAAGRKLFSADDRGALEIDLVYDSRQETTQRLRTARAAITEKLKAADLLSGQLLPLQDKLRTLDTSYSSRLSSYQQGLEAHNKVVAQ